MHVVSERAREAGGTGHVASLSFGWEPEQFYRDWAGYPLDAAAIGELKGPGLKRLAPQTDLAEEMLGHFRSLLSDPTYVDRIKRHYSMFRAKIEAEPYAGDEPVAMNRAQRRAARRRKPGSGGRSLRR